MNAPKAFASLSGGLLARKGSARPAMRRQNMGQVGPNGLEDLGWNDMGSEPAATNDEGGNVESISRNPLSGLTPSQPVVHDQQAQLAQQYAGEEDGEDYSDDHADLDDTTAELWDPEADDGPNVFTGNRDGKKSDALDAPAAVVAPSEPSEEVAETPKLESRETRFDQPPVSQSTFAPRVAIETEESDAIESENLETDDLDAPQLMRTVADLMPLTDAQRHDGGAWGDEDEADEVAEESQSNVATGLSCADTDADEEDGDIYGEEEEATAEEEAGEDFDPTAANRFASFISRPGREEDDAETDPGELQPMVGELSAFDDVPSDESYTDAVADTLENRDEAEDEGEDEDELVLDANMAIVDEPEADEPLTLETREVSNYEVAQASAGAKDKAAFTLRLDKQRHLKLRLACALTGQSAQKMVTEALDRLLAEMTELDELVEQAGGDRTD